MEIPNCPTLMRKSLFIPILFYFLFCLSGYAQTTPKIQVLSSVELALLDLDIVIDSLFKGFLYKINQAEDVNITIYGLELNIKDRGADTLITPKVDSTFLTKFVEDEVFTRISTLAHKNRNISILEREEIEKLMEEFEFNDSGAVKYPIIKMGEFVGATHIITGRMHLIHEVIIIHLSVVEISSRKVIWRNRGLMRSYSNLQKSRIHNKEIEPFRETIKVGNFLFEPIFFEDDNEKVYFTLNIRNQGKTRKLKIFGDSKMIDDIGIDYYHPKVKIGSLAKLLEKNKSHIKKKIDPGIRMRSVVAFPRENLSHTIRFVQLLDLVTNLGHVPFSHSNSFK